MKKPDFTERELRAMLDALTLVLTTSSQFHGDGAAIESARMKIAIYREKGQIA